MASAPNADVASKKPKVEDAAAGPSPAQLRQQFLDRLERGQPQPSPPVDVQPKAAVPSLQPQPSTTPSSQPPAAATEPAPAPAPSVRNPEPAFADPVRPPEPPSSAEARPAAASSTAPPKAAALPTGPAGGSNILRRLKKELSDLERDPPPGCSAHPDPDDFFRWVAIIAGPPGTPYEGGIFRLQIRFPTDYPFKPPKVQFLTKVYNQHVKDTGDICLDILKESWSPTINVSRLLVSITSLLTDPNPDFALDVDIAHQYKTDRAAYDRTVREWVQKFA